MPRLRTCGVCLILGGVCLLSAMRPVSGGTFPVANTTEYEAMKVKIRASQFLNLATFGATTEDINSLATRMSQIGVVPACEEWIDQQFALPASEHHPLAKQMVQDDGFGFTQTGINQGRYKYHAWWHNAVSAPDQLRQRIAWALIQIWVVGDNGPNFNDLSIDKAGEPTYLGIVDYYDMLLGHSFGNYRDIMEDVTLHPIMGRYLSHFRNPKPDPSTGRFPDENYARELMQLFTIGLYELEETGVFKKSNGELIPTYDNETIKEFSRVYTGLNYGTSTTFSNGGIDFHNPMKMYNGSHDTNVKTLFNGTVLPAGQTGLKDIDDGLDNIFNHANVGPFVSRMLIQRLVRSNPSTSYIRRVARVFADNGSGVRGDMQAVVKAILLDSEALSSVTIRKQSSPLALLVTTKETAYARLKEPMVRYTGMIRAFHPVSDYNNGRFMIPSLNGNMNQGPYQSPSVFNFYLPDFQPPGDLIGYAPPRGIPNGFAAAPEFGVLTAVTANSLSNRLRTDVNAQSANFTILNNTTAVLKCNVALNFSLEKQLATSDPQALMRHLDLLLCQGTMSDATKNAIATRIAVTSNADVRAETAILMTLISPDCAVSH